MRIAAFVTASVGVLLAVASARAAPVDAEVAVDVAPGCERIDEAQLVRLLGVESSKVPTSQASVKVVVICTDGYATLRVEERRGAGLPAPKQRRFAYADVVGEVGARVLALGAIELLNNVQPAAEPTLTAEPEGALHTLPRSAKRRPSVRLMAAGYVQAFAHAGPLVGGGLSADYVRIALLGLRLEGNVALAERSYELGNARMQLTTMSAQAGYLSLHESWTARAFLGYRFGFGRIAGTSANGLNAREGTVVGAWGGPLLSSGLGLRSRSWVGELAAEAGLVAFPHAHGRDVLDQELRAQAVGLFQHVAQHGPPALNRRTAGEALAVVDGQRLHEVAAEPQREQPLLVIDVRAE